MFFIRVVDSFRRYQNSIHSSQGTTEFHLTPHSLSDRETTHWNHIAMFDNKTHDFASTLFVDFFGVSSVARRMFDQNRLRLVGDIYISF